MATWVFGYGSLIFRPSFPYSRRAIGTVKGWTRRFWQRSPDHRGTPEAPGLVVTLVEDAASEVTGVAFEIEAGHEDETLRELEDRERAGYEKRELVVERREGGTLETVTFLAPPGNTDWNGPAPIAEIARRIAVSVGPSGRNDAYLYALAAALEDIGVVDSHVRDLAAAVRAASSG